MANITKPILLAVIGILAVVLFLQTSNLVTGKIIGESPLLTSQLGSENKAPSVWNVNFTMTAPGTTCGNDSTAIDCTAFVYDPNGWTNVSSVNGTLWYSGTGESGCDASADANLSDCYLNTSCYKNDSYNGTARTYHCVFDQLKWYALDGTWNCSVWATDDVDTGHNTSAWSATPANRDRDILRQIRAEPTIDWGSVTPGTNSTAVDNTVKNCGNRRLDLNVNATTMTCDIGTIKEGNISAGNTTAAWDIKGLQQAGQDRLHTNELYRPTYAATEDIVVNDSTYWMVYVPGAGVSGTCIGNITMTAIDDA